MDYKKIINSGILKTISKIADENNYNVFVVGGYVRDYILKNNNKKDIDILVLGDGILFAQIVASNLKTNIQVFKNFVLNIGLSISNIKVATNSLPFGIKGS